MSHRQPHEFPRRILLCVSGMSPQILTETLYALLHQDTPFIPTEIHLLSTAEGAEQARLSLLQGHCHFHRYCDEYGLSKTIFDESRISVITDDQLYPLADITTPRDNEWAADSITRKVNELTRNEESALHVSMAGGRKTMGYYAGYALSLFGRRQDRLSHVLVSEGFENLPDFYYPTRQSYTIYNREKKALDASKATVMLAEIPFVRLRQGLSDALLSGTTSFLSAVREAQRAEEPAELVVDIAHSALVCNGTSVRLSPVHFAFYLWILTADVPVKGIPKESKDFKELRNKAYASALMTQFVELYGDSKDSTRPSDALEDGMGEDYFSSNRSSLNAALTKALGNKMADPFLITNVGRRGDATYVITLKADQISFSQ